MITKASQRKARGWEKNQIKEYCAGKWAHEAFRNRRWSSMLGQLGWWWSKLLQKRKETIGKVEIRETEEEQESRINCKKKKKKDNFIDEAEKKKG